MTQIVSYWSDVNQFYRIHYPINYHSTCKTRSTLTPVPCGVVVIIHGGFWKAKYGIDTAAIESLAPYFVKQGYVGVEFEYRRVGHAGGGWPGTNNDIKHAYCTLCQDKSGWLDLNRVYVLGHSAGGQLALWLCAQSDITVQLQVVLLSTDRRFKKCTHTKTIGWRYGSTNVFR